MYKYGKAAEALTMPNRPMSKNLPRKVFEILDASGGIARMTANPDANTHKKKRKNCNYVCGVRPERKRA